MSWPYFSLSFSFPVSFLLFVFLLHWCGCCPSLFICLTHLCSVLCSSVSLLLSAPKNRLAAGSKACSQASFPNPSYCVNQRSMKTPLATKLTLVNRTPILNVTSISFNVLCICCNLWLVWGNVAVLSLSLLLCPISFHFLRDTKIGQRLFRP